MEADPESGARISLRPPKETIMRLVLMVLLALSSPALAAPPEIVDFCFAQIEKVRPPLTFRPRRQGSLHG